MAVATELTKVEVSVQGLPPGVLFQSKGLYALEQEEGGAAKKGKYRPPEEEAELRGHWMGRGKRRSLCIPSVMFYNAFCQAGKHFKDPTYKKQSMVSLLGSTIAVTPQSISLGTSEFTTFIEWVRIPPKTGKMVQIGRPLLPEWSVSFVILVDEEFWKASMLEDIIVLAGKRVGIGAWRPSLRGSYGKFVVTEFTVK